MWLSVSHAGVLSLGHAAEGILEVFSSCLKDDKRQSWLQWLPVFSLCMVPYFMWNTSAVQQWTLLSVEHRGVNLFTKQNPTCKPFLGAMVWTRALPLHLLWLRVLGCASGSSDWANKLLLIASWTAVQSTSECFLCWMLILKHYNHNLFWKCKWLHWPGPGFSAISCQVPSF